MPQDEHPNPLKGAADLIDQITTGSGEPLDDLRMGTIPAVLSRRSTPTRRTRVRPSERRRRRRQVTVTFSRSDIPHRLRALARRWGLTAPDARKPHISAVVEYLLLSQLDAAEAGEIPPPEKTE